MGEKGPLALYLRNFIFGVEDSLVSTVGLLSGIAAAGVSRGDILVTGIVLIFVEAFSMGVGSFLSEESAAEYVTGVHNLKFTINGGLVMFFSYFLAGFIPLFPYIFFTARAFEFSILFSLLALFMLGIAGSAIFGSHVLKNGLRMLIIGGLAIAVGVLVGVLIK